MAETSDYRITRTERVSVLTAEGRPVLGRRIWYQILATNSVDFVEIEDADFTPDRIRELIADAVDVLLELVS